MPISAKLFANLVTAAGANRGLAVDLHASQIQGFFRHPARSPLCQAGAAQVFRAACSRTRRWRRTWAGMKRARLREHARRAARDRRQAPRVGREEVEWEAMVGEVEGSDCLLVDDMIATGGSIVQAAQIVKRFGARRVFVTATHGVFCGSAIPKLEAAAEIERVVVTDTIPQDGKQSAKIEVLSVAPLLAEAISRIHRAESVSALFDDKQQVQK
ncbi:MAG: ribose-phosphate diphosphokinase [Planctomycetota bacterium]